MSFKTIVFYSLKGGVGRTTVAANIGMGLQSANRRVLLVDADPQNALGLHAGMDVGERFGLARDGISATHVNDYIASFGDRAHTVVPHLPFGHCTRQEGNELERQILKNPEWFKTRLRDRVPVDIDVVVVDAAPGTGALSQQALAVADLVVVVLQPDAASYVTVPTIGEFATGLADVPRAYLINGLDTRLPLHRDVRAALADALGPACLPWAIPYEPALGEALAKRKTLAEYAPDSHVLQDFHEVSKWIIRSLPEL